MSLKLIKDAVEKIASHGMNTAARAIGEMNVRAHKALGESNSLFSKKFLGYTSELQRKAVETDSRPEMRNLLAKAKERNLYLIVKKLNETPIKK